jgi:hypothetical protein
MNEKKPTIQFNKPPEEIVRSREEHLSEEQMMARERMESIKHRRPPLGGAPSVRIPPLNAQFIDGKTMNEQADILTDPTNPLSPSYNPELAKMQLQQQQAMPQHNSPFSPLPQSAKLHPGFRPGVGSMISGNQPAVTMSPQEPYKPQLRPETLESIKALENFRVSAESKQQQSVELSDEEREEERTKIEKKIPYNEGYDYRELAQIGRAHV